MILYLCMDARRGEIWALSSFNTLQRSLKTDNLIQGCKNRVLGKQCMCVCRLLKTRVCDENGENDELFEASKHYFQGISEPQRVCLFTKARLLKHDFPVHMQKKTRALLIRPPKMTKMRKWRLESQAKSAVNQRGREKKGPLDIAPQSFSQRRPKWCSVLSIGVTGKSALEIGHCLRRNFWMISGGPFLSRLLFYC